MLPGCQTIAFGPEIPDIESLLDAVEAAGFKGVEFAQRPSHIRHKGRPVAVDTLLELLKDRRLELVGLAGGSLDARMEFCGQARPRYLYVEEWSESAVAAQREGFTLALHPHLFKPIYRLGEAERLLNQHKDLEFIVDTAHLSIAGDSPDEAIELLKGRIAAVHFKDWRPDYGRHSHRYAKGFTELGHGIINLDRVLKLLQAIGYRGWLLWEQDASRLSPEESMTLAAHWFHEKGINLSHPPRPRPKASDSAPRQVPAHSDAREAIFLRGILRAGSMGVPGCYKTIMDSLEAFVGPSKFMAMWRCASAQESMSLLCSQPALRDAPLTGRSADLLSADAIAAQSVLRVDVTDPKNLGRFADPHLVHALGLRTMVTIPVLNPWNLNHVIMLIDICPTSGELKGDDSKLVHIAADIALAVDSAIEEVSATAAGRAAYHALTATTSQDLLERIRVVISDALSCETVAIFIADETGDRLELASGARTEWAVSIEDQFYVPGEGVTGKVWMSGEPLMTTDLEGAPTSNEKSVEPVSSVRRNCLFFPLVSAAGKRNVGVIRCCNKLTRMHGDTVPRVFSDDDVAVLDSIRGAVMSQLEFRIEQERRDRSLGRLTHELKVPVVAIRGAAESILKLPGAKAFFEIDYPGDILSWADLMRRLLGNANVYRNPQSASRPHQSPTLLLKDVVLPAVKQVEMLLKERHFSGRNIAIGDFSVIPRLQIDRNHFQQVVFNLLANAINHCYDDPMAFSVEILAEATQDCYIVRFRDHGPGIEQTAIERIFDEGYRGPAAYERNVPGEGLGLWVVREIVEGHGARISLTSASQPTEFSVFLGKELRSPHKYRGYVS